MAVVKRWLTVPAVLLDVAVLVPAKREVQQLQVHAPPACWWVGGWVCAGVDGIPLRSIASTTASKGVCLQFKDLQCLPIQSED